MPSNLRLGFIGSYVPKKCGIATFSRDLMRGIRQSYPKTEFFVAAAEEVNATYEYDQSVVSILEKNSKKSFRDGAKIFNKLNLDAVMLQHEFGLFGGKWTKFKHDGVKHTAPTGDNIFELINNIHAPIITTLHTVLPYPDPVRKEITRKIDDRSVMLVTMTQDSKRILCADYQIPENKIVVIPHGVPKQPRKNRSELLKGLNLSEKNFYLVTTGLISANKGIDLVIQALPNIIEKHPNVRLLVIGQTHPQIIASEGERYRESLIKIASRLKIQPAVIFINKYLETKELMQYLAAADIYLTPHRDPDQSASGTLAYAVGTGLLIISTPYRYAQELLANNRGFLVPFEDSVSIADSVNRLIYDTTLQKKTRESLKSYGSKMAWPSVARAYLKLIEDYAK